MHDRKGRFLILLAVSVSISCVATQPRKQHDEQHAARSPAAADPPKSASADETAADERSQPPPEEPKAMDVASVRDRIMIAQAAVKDVLVEIKRKDVDKSELDLAD